VIEARWLFGLGPDRIDVIIHPESVVHSFVEFVDGSVLAQLSPPDMRLPIQYALTYPERVAGPAKRLDWRALAGLHFQQPDRDTFAALELGFEVARRCATRRTRPRSSGSWPAGWASWRSPGAAGRCSTPTTTSRPRRSSGCWHSTGGPATRRRVGPAGDGLSSARRAGSPQPRASEAPPWADGGGRTQPEGLGDGRVGALPAL